MLYHLLDQLLRFEALITLVLCAASLIIKPMRVSSAWFLMLVGGTVSFTEWTYCATVLADHWTWFTVVLVICIPRMRVIYVGALCMLITRSWIPLQITVIAMIMAALMYLAVSVLFAYSDQDQVERSVVIIRQIRQDFRDERRRLFPRWQQT